MNLLCKDIASVCEDTTPASKENGIVELMLGENVDYFCSRGADLSCYSVLFFSGSLPNVWVLVGGSDDTESS